MSDNCIFCQIINKELPNTLVYEDEEFVAFKDIQPKAPVHVLVVPKIHKGSINDATDEDRELLGKWLLTAKVVAHKVGVGKAYQLKMYVGAGAGQTVGHLHLHVLGGWDKPQLD